jgi:hypothetical protein
LTSFLYQTRKQFILSERSQLTIAREDKTIIIILNYLSLEYKLVTARSANRILSYRSYQLNYRKSIEEIENHELIE